MKLVAIAVAACLLLPGGASAATNVYQAAHTRHQNANMVLVVVNSRFFYGSAQDQSRWFTAIQQCVRSVNLAGQTIVVTNDNGRFRYYGPKSWHKFLGTIDMAWVRARVNKQLTCNF